MDMSVDHLLEKMEGLKNAKPIPDILQVHTAIRHMDVSYFAIFFKLACRHRM